VKTLSDDTTPAAEAALIRRARELSPAEKLELVAAMTRSLWGLAEAGVRSRHPAASDEEARRRLAARVLPPELVLAAFGWDPRREGY
jgi:hypothetical protein